MSRLSASIAAVLAAAPLACLHAQPLVPQFTAGVSGYTAIGISPIPSADRVSIVELRNDGLNRAEASGSGGQLQTLPVGTLGASVFNSAAVSGFALAEPGILRVSGANRSVANSSSNGLQSPTFNAFSSSSSIAVGASFTDYVTVNSPTLAVGTRVSLPINFLLEAVSTIALGFPQFSAHAIGMAASFTLPGFGPQNFSTESGSLFLFQTRALPGGNLFYTLGSRPGLSVLANVGDVLTIGASMSIFGTANVDPNNEGITEFGGAIDATNTTALWFGTMPAGVSLTSASGHDYTIDPKAVVPASSVVPLPPAVALMLGGLGLLGCAAGRRARARGKSDPAVS